MSWSMWGGKKSEDKDEPKAKDDAPKKKKESRNAWFNGVYQGPVWGITAAIGLSIYLRYFSGTAYEDKAEAAQLITVGVPLAVAIGCAFYAWTIFKGKPPSRPAETTPTPLLVSSITKIKDKSDPEKQAED